MPCVNNARMANKAKSPLKAFKGTVPLDPQSTYGDDDKIYKSEFTLGGKVHTKQEYIEHLTYLATNDRYDEKTHIAAMKLIGQFIDNGWLTEKAVLAGDPDKPIRHIYTFGTKNLGGPV